MGVVNSEFYRRSYGSFIRKKFIHLYSSVEVLEILAARRPRYISGCIGPASRVIH